MSEKEREAPRPSMAAITLGLLLWFVVSSFTVSSLAAHTGLLVDRVGSATSTISLAKTN